MAAKNTGVTPVFGNIGDRPLSSREMMLLIVRLSIPSILAQISATVMQYIDAAMVGSLGADATGAIGLVASTTWLFNGLGMAAATGFSVQVAQLIGAGRNDEAKNVLRQSLIVCLMFGLIVGSAAVWVSFYLPTWLGGKEEVLAGAHSYFMVFGAAIPFNLMRVLTGNMLQCAGDTPYLQQSLRALHEFPEADNPVHAVQQYDYVLHCRCPNECRYNDRIHALPSPEEWQRSC